ncbi:MAG: hypothetical protein ACE5E6_12500 [Phycisphaerae bacterium]
MKQAIGVCAMLVCVMSAIGQESDITSVTTTETTAGGVDFFAPLFVEDAVPLDTAQFDLRLRFDWVTGFGRDNVDGDDQYAGGARLVWGAADNLELSADVAVNLGDAGELPGDVNGNGDVIVGMLYRFVDGASWMDGVSTSLALGAKARIPSGHDSSGVDGELRLNITNDYGDGVRSHVNGFVLSANGDNDTDVRDLQWGAVVGLDGPLCNEGAVRWILDYLHRSSIHDGIGNLHLLELGAEWTMSDSQKLGLSTQVGLDHNDDVPNWGARVNYVYSINY